MIPADLIEMLRCPQSGQELVLADADVLARLNERILQLPQATDGVRNQAGLPVERPMEAALLRVDRLLLYPVRDDIPVLLAEEAIRL